MSLLILFMAVIFVSSILFGGWVILTIGRFIARIVSSTSRGGVLGSSARGCGNPGCRAINPVHANYCRRCGSNLANARNNARATTRPPKYDPATGNGRRVAV
jgi:hypothetical protein